MRWALIATVLVSCVHPSAARADSPQPAAPKRMKGLLTGHEYVARGNCLILEPRRNARASWVEDWCDRDVRGDIGTGYQWFSDRLWDTFDFAEQVACGKAGCATRDRAVRFYVTWGQAPWFTSSSDEKHIEFRMSTAFVDVTEAFARTYLAELRAKGQGEGARLTAWLNAIAARSGQPCEPMTSPDRSVATADIPMLVKISQWFYAFAMLHELSHVVEGQDCGAGVDADDLTREIACDLKAFDFMGKVPGARFPAPMILPLIVLSHHQALLDPLLAKEMGFTGDQLYSEVLSASRWHERAETLTNYWETLCFKAPDLKDVTCNRYRDLVDHTRQYLAKPLPGACGPARPAPPAIAADPAAAACVRWRTDRTDIAWVRDGDPPIVKVTAAYRNACRRPLRCSAGFETGTRPVDGSPAGEPPWLKVNVVERRFDLEPDKLHRVDATVGWTRTATRYPAVRYPEPPRQDMDLLACQFAGPEVAEDAGAPDEAWCGPIQQAIAAAQGDFKDLTTGEGRTTPRGLRIFGTKFRLPGSSDCRVVQGKTPRVSCDYDDFEADAALDGAYANAVAALRTCLPSALPQERVDHDEEGLQKKTELAGEEIPIRVVIDRSSAGGKDEYHSLEVDIWKEGRK